MATKPGSLPEWNSGGTNNVEPSGGKKVLGWVTDEVPPSATLNWWMGKVHNWLQWVDNGILTDLAATAMSWTAAHAFSAGVTLTRSNDYTNPLVSGAATSPGAYRYLGFLGGSSSNTLRLFLGFDGSLLVSRNAHFIYPGNWGRDDAGDSQLYTFGPNGFTVRTRLDAQASPWTDGSWTAGAAIAGGAGTFPGAVTISTAALGASTVAGLTASGDASKAPVRISPLASAPVDAAGDGQIYYDSATKRLRVRADGAWVDLNRNELEAKAWVRLLWDGGAASLYDSVGVSGVTLEASNYIRVTFSSPLPNDDYTVIGNAMWITTPNKAVLVSDVTRATTHCDFRVHGSLDGSAILNPALTIGTASLVFYCGD